MINTIPQELLVWASPIIIIIVGLILGLLFKQFIHSQLLKMSKKTDWQGDDVIIKSIESQIVFWFLLGSLAVVARGLDLEPTMSEYLSRFILVGLIFSITVSASKMMVGLFDLWTAKQDGGLPSTTMFVNIVRITIYVVGALIILDTLKISIAPMLTALGVGGLAVSLALKDTLTDVFAGLHILLSQKIKIGDFIEMESGQMGYITNITWRNTTMQERANNVFTIPNTKLSAAIIKNYDSGDPSFSVRVPIGVSYESNLDHVLRVTLDVANEIHNSLEETSKDYEPAVRLRNFGESSIDLMVYFRGKKYGDQHPIIHAFVKRIHERYNEEGIDIPFPIRTLIQKETS